MDMNQGYLNNGTSTLTQESESLIESEMITLSMKCTRSLHT